MNNKKSVTKTFRITEDMMIRLDDLSEYYSLDKTTFYRMAMFNGCRSVLSGQYPMIEKRNYDIEKIDVEVVVSKDLFSLWDDTVEYIKNNSTETKEYITKKYPDIFKYILKSNSKDNNVDMSKLELEYNRIAQGIIFERFLEIEILRLERVYKFHELEDISLKNKQVRIDLPLSIYGYIGQIVEKTRIPENKLWRYLLLKGIMSEIADVYSYTEVFNPKVIIGIENLAATFGIKPFKVIILKQWLEELVKNAFNEKK